MSVQVTIPETEILKFAERMGVLPSEAAEALGAPALVVEKMRAQDAQIFLDQDDDESDYAFS